MCCHLGLLEGFCGYDLKTGCQKIAVISAIASILVSPFIFYLAVFGIMENPDFNGYGELATFQIVSVVLAIKQIVGLVFCLILYKSSKSENVYGLRFWLRSSGFGFCISGVFLSYCTALLFAGGHVGLAVPGLIILLIFVPTKIYFGWVVCSYYTLLIQSWEVRIENLKNVFYQPTYMCTSNIQSCRAVPLIRPNQPTVVIVKE